MTRSERAAQLWPLLTFCATTRHVLNYDQAARHIGVLRPAMGSILEPIQSYCLLNDLPALSVIVVGGKSGLPGEGFVASAHVPHEQSRVFNHPWLDTRPPGPEALEVSVKQLPSKGRALAELMRQIADTRA
jgi:hypothetical protein